jgi:hypothetical protein
MRRRSLWISGLAASFCTGYAAAHHSFASIFDSRQPVEITGTVTRVEWMNPHVWIYMNVAKDDGAVEEWAFEMGSPNRLTRYGWHQNSLAAGQTATIAGSRARDGSLKAAVDTVTLPTGEELFGAQETSR